MSRAALIVAAAVSVLGAAAHAAGPNPHIDPSRVLKGCAACHRGHGASRSPMLPGPQDDVCLACHGTRASLDQQIAKRAVSADARPSLLSYVLSQPYTHPLSPQAFSEEEPQTVVCTSCHSPHRAMPERTAAGLTGPLGPLGRKKLSPKSPSEFEHELCESCHGNAGATTQSRLDISRLFDSTSRSFHPVETLAFERSPSVLPTLSGREINCTDCHGNSDPLGPLGPHGSAVPFLLRWNYAATDGAPESAGAYELCYRCHSRQAILERSPFPEHARHIVNVRGSCATCHNGHGSVKNRALIRFGEETSLAGVSPSATGKLAFVSTGPGSGSCYLICHGTNHDPLSYGSKGRAPGLVPRLGTVGSR